MRAIIPHSKIAAGIMLSSILASIGLIGGLGLQLVRKDIVEFLPLLIALPALNAIAGEYATITAAHLADPENYRKRTIRLLLALFISLPISCLGLSLLSLGVAYMSDYVVDRQLIIDFTRLLFVTMYSVVGAMFIFIYLTRKVLTRMNVNIDDTLIPIANTIASVLALSGFSIMIHYLI